MDTNASFGLYNAYLDVYSSVEEISDLDLINENVSSGRAKRASSTRAPIQPMPTHAEIQQIKKDAKQTERPKAAEPVDNSISAMKARFKAEEEKEKREAEEKTKTILPSRGIRSDEPVLRGRTKKRKSGGLAQAKLNKLRDELRHTGDPVTANRVKKIRAALVSKRKWGRQNEEVKAILHFLINENYCDTLDEAMNMAENISDDGLCYIIENIDQIPQTYDIILEYLLDEGYCDDIESAEIIMVNMSEEWRDEILDEVYKPLPKEKMDAKAKNLVNKAREARELANTFSQIPKGFRTITGTKGLPQKLRDKSHEFVKRSATISAVSQLHDPERMRRRDTMVADYNHKKAQLRQALKAEAEDAPRSNIRSFKRKLGEEFYELVLDYLIDEGYCSDVQSAEMVIENMSQEWVDEIVEAYVDWRKGKLPSGRTPRQSATRSANTQVAKAKNKIRANQGSLASTLHDPTVKKAKSKENRINAVKGEMDSHTSFGGVVNKLLTPGLGNRSNATPRMAHGEPNTDRHQGARFRRTGKEYGQH